MPTRGYRKGLSDSREPLTRFVRMRLSDRDYAQLVQKAKARSMTLSKLTRTILGAHVTGQRVKLPHANHTSALLRELARIGNNLNHTSES